MGLIGLIVSFIAVVILVLIPLAGVWAAGFTYLFGVVIPYVAALIFFVGLVYRIVKWGRAPVPFRIPTTCGQEKSLPWIKSNEVDNPHNLLGVLVRMFLEVFCFRSLFRSISLDFRSGRAYYSSSKWLWLFALSFHYAFLVVVIRHLRFFTEPVPALVNLIESLDGFIEVGVGSFFNFFIEKIDAFFGMGLGPLSNLPVLLMSGVVLMMAVTYLLLRRLVLPQLRYISLANDYFPLFLILAIGTSGLVMRYLLKVDVVSTKELTMSLANFSPKVPEGIGTVFYVHLFLVSAFFAYFPFSKLMHLGGIFLSPTRNLVNNSRRVRHVNPWNYPVKTHSYEEYEDDFRELMIEVGLPVEKEEVEEAEEKGVENGATEA